MSGRRRVLTGEELALWRYATRAVKRLHALSAETAPPPPAAAASAEGAGGVVAAAKPAPPAARSKPFAGLPAYVPPPQVRAATGPLPALERRERQDLKHGRADIDAVLDLHGLTQDEAHHALNRFVRSQQRMGAKRLLVVTGKGGEADFAGQGRGVLRRMVPHWLRSPELRPCVLAFEQAAQRHGGAGALYLRLRRGLGP